MSNVDNQNAGGEVEDTVQSDQSQTGGQPQDVGGKADPEGDDAVGVEDEERNDDQVGGEGEEQPS